MIHLFIDSNILLNFYHYSNEDLERLQDLVKLIKNTQVKLYLPEQVINEVNRNREGKINDALKRFNEKKLNYALPQICKGYVESESINKAVETYNQEKNKLNKNLKQAVKNKTLKADLIIQQLFNSGDIIKVDDEIFINAKRRFDMGNPPGKKGSYGDAIIWETLLKIVDEKSDLYFISADTDFASIIEEINFSQFLEDEWTNIKKTNIFYYDSLSNFFNDKYPGIKINDEYIKDIKIEAFKKSNSFDNARAQLEELVNIGDFSDGQINKIVKASIVNSQIYLAHHYSPELIGKKLEEIISGRENCIKLKAYSLLCSKFNIQRVKHNSLMLDSNIDEVLDQVLDDKINQTLDEL